MSDSKVEQIRQAGRTLFLRQGYHRTSTSALAREAGVSKETLYSRYPSKEAILVDVLEQLIPVDQLVTPNVPVVRTREDLEQALTQLAAEVEQRLTQRDYLELVRIIIAETPRMPQLGRIFSQAVPERLLRRVEHLLAAARGAGLIEDVDLAAAARMFLGPVLIDVIMNGLLVAPSQSAGSISGGGDHPQIALLMAALAPAVPRPAVE